MFDSGLLVGEDIVFQPSRYKPGEDYSLHKIFKLLAAGWSSKKIRKQHPDILPETITMARSVLIGRNADFFPHTQNDRIFHDFKVLTDENISPAVSGYLRLHFKKVSHVNDVGLAGKPDERIWEWAINNSYDVIFTKDVKENSSEDLTMVAAEDAKSIIRAIDERDNPNITLAALPLLVHLPGGNHTEDEVKKLLRRSKQEFFSYLDNRSTPYIDVRGGRIICGPTYFELRGENHIKDNNITEVELSQAKLETKERMKFMWLSRLSEAEIRNMTPERESRVDRLINAAVGMGGRLPQESYIP